MPNKQEQVVIIGAGFGGLATACLLGQAGYKVTVYESRSQLGGRAGQLKIKGFTFDTGPSWYLMPEVYERYFGLFGKSPADYLDLIKLSPAYKVFFESADNLAVTGDQKQDAKSFESIEPGAGKQLIKYLDSAEQIYNLSLKYFLYTTFQTKQLLRPEIVGILPKLLKILRLSMDDYVSKYFNDPKIKQLLEYPSVFLGTSPFEAPALYHLMSYLDFRQGVWYPRGGIYKIVESLKDLAIQNNVDFKLGSPVTHINTQDGKVKSITLSNGSKINADIVISNADMHYTQTKLLYKSDQDYPASYWQKRQAGPSALLMYLGVKGECPELQHHNLIFTSDWQANFKKIFKDKSWPVPASIYICKASQTDSSVAPKGHENIFVLVPLHAQPEINKAEIDRYSDIYLDQIAEMTGIKDLKARIVYQKNFGPNDFAEQFNAWQGTALGLSHKLNQSAFFRPKTKSRKVKNLYYVGANVQPGIGLPMCLISAELVFNQIAGK